MCKRVGIELEGGATSLDLYQKEFSIIQNGASKSYKPGEYPEPCQMEIPNVEVFHVGLFLIVRIYQPNNPFFVKFEVSWTKSKVITLIVALQHFTEKNGYTAMKQTLIFMKLNRNENCVHQMATKAILYYAARNQSSVIIV